MKQAAVGALLFALLSLSSLAEAGNPKRDRQAEPADDVPVAAAWMEFLLKAGRGTDMELATEEHEEEAHEGDAGDESGEEEEE